jgi:ABC-type branched-subunit amino acid transport system ATPase component
MPAILKLDDVSKQFGGVRAVYGFSFAFYEKEITALIGPNGAGKTTAFNLIGGHLRPDTGTVTFEKHIHYDTGMITTEKHILSGQKPWDIAALGIGRLFQDVRLFKKMTVLENVMAAFRQQKGEMIWRVLFSPQKEFEQESKRRKQAMELLERVGLAEKAGALAENLSYGQQKLVAIARLLAADAKLLLLDEPTAGVNPGMIESLLDIVRDLVKEGRTVIFVEHNIKVVRDLADWVVFMAAGKVQKFGSLEDVLDDPEIRAMYVGQHAIKNKHTST